MTRRPVEYLGKQIDIEGWMGEPRHEHLYERCWVRSCWSQGLSLSTVSPYHTASTNFILRRVTDWSECLPSTAAVYMWMTAVMRNDVVHGDHTSYTFTNKCRPPPGNVRSIDLGHNAKYIARMQSCQNHFSFPEHMHSRRLAGFGNFSPVLKP